MKVWRNQSGMTLIEIMVVIALIAGIIVAGATRVGGSGRKMKQAVRSFAILGKNLHAQAKLFNKTYRIVIRIPEDEDEEHTYWVESSSDKVKLMSEEREAELAKLTKLQREGLVKKYGWAMDSRITKKPMVLPEPLKFKRVEFAAKDAPREEGDIYIHFFPQGLIEEAAIYITGGEKLNWTIAYHPVTGKADVIQKDVELKNLRDYEEER